MIIESQRHKSTWRGVLLHAPFEPGAFSAWHGAPMIDDGVDPNDGIALRLTILGRAPRLVLLGHKILRCLKLTVRVC
jgi:hypothetical protein